MLLFLLVHFSFDFLFCFLFSSNSSFFLFCLLFNRKHLNINILCFVLFLFFCKYLLYLFWHWKVNVFFVVCLISFLCDETIELLIYIYMYEYLYLVSMLCSFCMSFIQRIIICLCERKQGENRRYCPCLYI